MDPEDLSQRFQWLDYLIFFLMLTVSAGIGVFYGCFGGGQKTTSDFLMAGRSMGVFPMSMSLIASFMSAITLLGTPVEMYQYGTQYILIGLAYPLVMAATAYLYLPVFFSLQVTSAYEYLEARFSKSVRILGSTIFIGQMTFYLSLVVYAPALAISQVTGINVHISVGLIFFICIFYTSLGGMRAVQVTDLFQVIIMFCAMSFVVGKGVFDLGGFEVIWEKANEGKRIEFFNIDFDPRERHTLWALVIGGYFTWLAIYAGNQSQIQRYLTVPTLAQAQCAIWINWFGLSSLLVICCCGGLVLYARFAECHPIYEGRVKTPDQLFPLFVMDTLGTIPGLPGLFVAGIFSGALSTVSSGLNSLAAITLEDFIKGLCWKGLDDSKGTRVSQGLSVFFGLASFGLVFVAEQLGGVLQAALSIFGIIGGPLLGVFTLGMFFPWANPIGAFVGTLTSLGVMMWLGFGANIAIARGQLVIPTLSFRTDGCPPDANITIPDFDPGQEGGILEFYRISYMYYSFMAVAIVILVGLFVSILTNSGNMRKDIRRMNPNLISPPIHSFVINYVPKSIRELLLWEVGDDIGVVKNLDSFLNGIENPGFQLPEPDEEEVEEVEAHQIVIKPPNLVRRESICDCKFELATRF